MTRRGGFYHSPFPIPHSPFPIPHSRLIPPIPNPEKRASPASGLLLEAFCLLDPVIRGIDLAGARLGALAHVFGQVAEAIGVVFGNQLAIGALDRALVGIA